MFDFANILLSGACNARCPQCIGRQIDRRLKRDNLDEYPPRNLDKLIELIWQEGIRQVVVTGTNTDPQLYRHEARLLEQLRGELPAGTQMALHTNGRAALHKMAVFNQYDRAAISLPSFSPLTYRKMMGVEGIPNMYDIMNLSTIIIKISCIITDDNAAEAGSFLEKCRALGVRRVVLRKLYGEKRGWQELLGRRGRADEGETVRRVLARIGDKSYRGCPVVELEGMQVTLWDFAQTESTSLNLFSSGLISDRYLLTEAGGSQG